MGSSAATAQTTAGGKVASAATGVLVPGAVISGLDPAGDTVASTLSGPDGTFRIVLPTGGAWLIEVAHIGFKAFSTRVSTTIG